MSFVAVITPVKGNPEDPGTVTPPIALPPAVIWPPQLPPLPPNVVAPPIALPPNLPTFPIIIPDDPSKPIVMPPIANPPTVWPPIDPSAGLPPGARTLVLAWIAGVGWRWLLVDLSQPKK